MLSHLAFKNYMEEAVEVMLNRVAPQYPDICMCDRCRTGMLLVAQRRQRQRCISARKGAVLQRAKGMELQYEVEVLTEVMRAVQIVGGQPHHGRTGAAGAEGLYEGGRGPHGALHDRCE